MYLPFSGTSRQVSLPFPWKFFIKRVRILKAIVGLVALNTFTVGLNYVDVYGCAYDDFETA